MAPPDLASVTSLRSRGTPKVLWVHKCRARPRERQRAWGDWEKEVFSRRGGTPWTSSTNVSGPSRNIMLHQIEVGHYVLAYQTDTKAAIGLCRIDRLIDRGRGERQMIVTPTERFAVRVKLHNLKKTDPQLRRVRALRQGPVAALYPTSPQEARVLLRACRTATTSTKGPAQGRTRSR
jgi:hypothetical protein